MKKARAKTDTFSAFLMKKVITHTILAKIMSYYDLIK